MNGKAKGKYGKTVNNTAPRLKRLGELSQIKVN
jgi:hypothetical protein